MKSPDRIELGHGRWVPKHAISFEAIRASGPGGQHVNKVATAVRMRVVLEHVKGLHPEARARLVTLSARFMEALRIAAHLREGDLLMVCEMFFLT